MVLIALLYADVAGAYPPSNYAGAMHVAAEKNRAAYSDSDRNSGGSNQPSQYNEEAMNSEAPDLNAYSDPQYQGQPSYIHPTTAEEFAVWAKGYEMNGGDPEIFSDTNPTDGWYTIEKDFCMFIYDWQIDGNTTGDGNVRNILVPNNVTFLGGAVASDMHLYLMKNFSIVSGTPSAFTHRTTPQEFEQWLRGYAARNSHPEKFYGTDLSDGWYTIEKDFSTEVTCDVTFIDFQQAYLGKEQIRWIRDGSIKHLVVPPGINYTGGDIGNDIEIHLMNDSSLLGTRIGPETTEIVRLPMPIEEITKDKSENVSIWVHYRDKIEQYLSYL